MKNGIHVVDWSRHLKLKHMSLLITLGETGSLSEAARLTFTTQPALSRWLKELEEDVGDTLFERHARGLIPTEMGAALIEHAKRINTEVLRAQHNLEALKHGSSQSVAIGTSPASAPNFVPSAITRFLKLSPNSRVEIQEGTMNALLERLKLGELDVVVGRLDNYKPHTTIQSEILFQESVCIVSRVNHPLTMKNGLTWNDLYQYDWIIWPDGTPIRSKFDMALTSAGKKPPRYRVESSSQVGNLWLLQNTDMLSVASERVANHFHERGLMSRINVEFESSDGTVGMCWRDEDFISQPVKALLDCFRQSSGEVAMIDRYEP